MKTLMSISGAACCLKNLLIVVWNMSTFYRITSNCFWSTSSKWNRLFSCQHNLDIWFVVFNIWSTVFLLLIYIAPTLLHVFVRPRRFYLIYFTINIDFHLVLIFIHSSPSFDPHKLSLNLQHLYLVFSLLFF